MLGGRREPDDERLTPAGDVRFARFGLVVGVQLEADEVAATRGARASVATL